MQEKGELNLSLSLSLSFFLSLLTIHSKPGLQSSCLSFPRARIIDVHRHNRLEFHSLWVESSTIYGHISLFFAFLTIMVVLIWLFYVSKVFWAKAMAAENGANFVLLHLANNRLFTNWRLWQLCIVQVYGAIFPTGQVVKAFFFSQVIHYSITSTNLLGEWGKNKKRLVTWYMLFNPVP